MLSVDDMVKNIVTTLDENKVLDETFIIFSSDNGFHLGKNNYKMMNIILYAIPVIIVTPSLEDIKVLFTNFV